MENKFLLHYRNEDDDDENDEGGYRKPENNKADQVRHLY